MEEDELHYALRFGVSDLSGLSSNEIIYRGVPTSECLHQKCAKSSMID